MTLTIIGIVLAASAVSYVLVSYLLRARSSVAARADHLLREHLLDRYVVTVLSGETFSGLLAGVDDRSVVLRDVTVLSSSNSSVVDGEITLRRESIAYMQRP